jgi:hypothetical protein
MKLPPDVALAIDASLETLASEWGDHPSGVAPIAIRHKVLPLYLDWTGFFALSRNGDVLWIDWDATDVAEPVSDLRWRDIGLIQGARRYPALRALLPGKSPGATICPGCSGSGDLGTRNPALKELVCQCAGLGWIPEYWTA